MRMNYLQKNMENSQTQENNQTRYLILDTNILSRAGAHIDRKNVVGSLITEYLRDILSKSPNWDIALSSVTLFELTDRSSLENEVINAQAINGMKVFDVNQDILRCAGRLGSFYKEQGINDTQISAMDKIIGATAVLTGSIIYTIDMRDYPAPFFVELTQIRKTIEYKNKDDLPVFLTTYFMSPVSEVIDKYYNQRMLPITQGKMSRHFALNPVKNLIQNKESLSIDSTLHKTKRLNKKAK